MADESGSRRTPHLKTYSRRVKPRVGEPPLKKQRIEEVPIFREPSPVEIFARSSIQSYFQPVRTTSSSTSGRSAIPTSDPIGASPSIPSSPPPRCPSPRFQDRKSQKRPKRRLTTRLPCQPLAKMHRGADGNLYIVNRYGLVYRPFEALSDETGKEYFMYDDVGEVIPLVGNDYGEAVEDSDRWRREEFIQRREARKADRKHRREDAGSDNDEVTSDTDVGDTNRDDNGKTESAGISAKPATKGAEKPRSKVLSAKYRQTTLDLGLDSFKACEHCGMFYNSTRAEDVKTHTVFHNGFLHGATFKKSSKLPDVTVKMEVLDGKEHRIQALTCRDALEWRIHFESALEAAAMYLPGPVLESAELWGEIQNPNLQTYEELVPRYKVFVYYIDRKIVGVLLVERIKAGVPCDLRGGEKSDHGGGPEKYKEIEETIDVSNNHDQLKVGIQKCYMSVDRIWVDSSHRRQGIATALVDSARKKLIPNMDVSKDRMAFSWPTKLGIGFALGYCRVFFKDHGYTYAFLICEADFPEDEVEPGGGKQLKPGEDGAYEPEWLQFGFNTV